MPAVSSPFSKSTDLSQVLIVRKMRFFSHLHPSFDKASVALDGRIRSCKLQVACYIFLCLTVLFSQFIKTRVNDSTIRMPAARTRFARQSGGNVLRAFA